MKHFKFLMILGACAFSLAATVHADTTGDNAAQAVARAALLAQMNAGTSTNQPAASAPVAVPAPKPVAVAPVVVVVTNAAPVMPAPQVVNPPVIATAPIAAPAAHKSVIITPASGAPDTKETRLAVLSAQYKANQISPLEYFTQREALMKGN